MTDQLHVIWRDEELLAFGSAVYADRVVLSLLSGYTTIRGAEDYVGKVLIVAPFPGLVPTLQAALWHVHDGHAEFDDVFPTSLCEQGFVIANTKNEYKVPPSFHYTDPNNPGQVHTLEQPQGVLTLYPHEPGISTLAQRLLPRLLEYPANRDLRTLLDQAKAGGVIEFDFVEER